MCHLQQPRHAGVSLRPEETAQGTTGRAGSGAAWSQLPRAQAALRGTARAHN